MVLCVLLVITLLCSGALHHPHRKLPLSRTLQHPTLIDALLHFAGGKAPCSEEMGRIDMALQQQVEDSSSFVLPLNRRFPVKAAEEVMTSVLQSRLRGEVYSADQASQLAKNLGASLRDALVALSRPRYRIGVTVDLGEDCGQGIRVGSRCFWDSKTDSVARAVYRSSSLFCVATAYAVYQY